MVVVTMTRIVGLSLPNWFEVTELGPLHAPTTRQPRSLLTARASWRFLALKSLFYKRFKDTRMVHKTTSHQPTHTPRDLHSRPALPSPPQTRVKPITHKRESNKPSSREANEGFPHKQEKDKHVSKAYRRRQRSAVALAHKNRRAAQKVGRSQNRTKVLKPALFSPWESSHEKCKWG